MWICCDIFAKGFAREGFGGRHGVRTHDPHVANVVLSQLS